MIDFEAYNIEAWMADGLAMPPPARAQADMPKRASYFKATMLLPAVAVGVLALYGVTPMAQYFVPTPVSAEMGAAPSGDIVGLPSQYWSSAINALTYAPTVAESGPADPPPRY